MIMLGDDKKRKMPSIIVSMIRKEKDGHDESKETPAEEEAEFTDEEIEEGEAYMEEIENAASRKEKVIAHIRFHEWCDRCLEAHGEESGEPEGA